MHVWLESAKRGGVAAGCELRTAQANNPFLPGKLYDETKPTTYLMAFDVNNLYGKALQSYLPTHGFRWIEYDSDLWEKIQADPTSFFKNYDNDVNKPATTGFTVEVDLSFPPDIHDKLKGLTPVPYKRTVQFDELSPEQQEMFKNLNLGDTAMATPRLVTDLYPKKNYVVHYRVLKLYLDLGVKLDKVHKGIMYNQSDVLKCYMLRLAKNREQAKTTFEKDLWKLAANAVYGKSVESVRNRSNFVIIRSREQAMRYNKKPTVAGVMMLEVCELVILRMKKLSVTLDKPLYLGITVLDEAKRILYDWFYNKATKNGETRLELLQPTPTACIV